MKTQLLIVSLALSAAASAAPRVEVRSSPGTEVRHVGREVRADAPHNSAVFRRLPAQRPAARRESSEDMRRRLRLPQANGERLLYQYDDVMLQQTQQTNPYGHNLEPLPGTTNF